MKDKTTTEAQTSEARPPVVGIFGHIDHGKSTLIDYIRKTNITEKEAGGITQHVSAYEVLHALRDGREAKITFIDTPGHEAFTGIRTRGAQMADIAILVVSAEDGVKPQTLESLKFIQESKLPYIVAITKIDKSSADIVRTKQSLAENNVFVEGYGGDTPVVALSAVTGAGIDDLLEMIVLVSELEGKTAERDTLASGVIIESKLDPKRGIVGVGVIKNGTARKGLFVATKSGIAPLRYILDAEENQVEELSFSSPIQIVGWDKMPKSGEEFLTFLKKTEAQEYQELKTEKPLNHKQNKEEEETHVLPLVIKADTFGSLEALEQEIQKLKRERIVPKIVFSGVGSIGENDIKVSLASGLALVIGFNTKVDSSAGALAERNGVSILNKNIIYEIIDEVKKLLETSEPKIEVEETQGVAKILKIFSVNKNKQVIGARVTSGTIEQNSLVKIIRRESEVGQGRVRELQSAKVKTGSVSEGQEFGALIESKLEIAPGDMIEAVKVVVK